MSTTKITDLTAYTDPINTDVLPIVDVTSDVTKKVSIANVMKNASLGSAAAPGISFDGDPNTGIYSPGANQVAISTDGTARLTAGTTAITAAIPVDVLLGSASTPSYTFTGDLNTGIYSPGADQVAISTNGTGRLFVDNAGQVGIGLSPSYRFDVAGPFRFRSQGYLYDTAGTSQLIRFTEIGARDARMDAFNGTDFNGTLRYAGANLLFETGTSASVTERLRITSDGKVGVGTSSPPTILTVNGIDPLITFQNAATNRWQLGYENTNSHRFVLYDTNAAAYRLVVDSSGRLGVGTTSPAALITVAGASGAGIDLDFPGGISTGTEFSTLRFTASNPSFVGAEIRGIHTNGGTNLGVLTLHTSGSEKLRIDSSGRVGIGTSSPGSTLTIVSTASTTTPAFQVASSGSLANNDIVRLQINGLTNGFRMFQDASSNVRYSFEGGNVGIGTSTPATDVLLTVGGNDTDSGIMLDRSSGDNCAIHNVGGNLVFKNGGNSTVSGLNERARIDSSGRLLVGTSSSSGAPSSGAVIQLADQFSVRAVNGGGITNKNASTASGTTLNCVIDVPMSSNIYGSFIGTLYICQQLSDASKSFLAEYRVKIYNSGGTATFTLVDSVDDSSPNNVVLTFAYSNSNRQITVTSTWTTATSSAIICTLVGAGGNV